MPLNAYERRLLAQSEVLQRLRYGRDQMQSGRAVNIAGGRSLTQSDIIHGLASATDTLRRGSSSWKMSPSQALVPIYAEMTAGSRRTASGMPSAMTRPASRTVIHSASLIKNHMWCST